jgi:hypothetical protein
MDMTQFTILGRLRLMAGLDDKAAHEALPDCAAAFEQLMPRVKPGATLHDPRLDQAAAGMALCMLAQRCGGEDDIVGFKAGDITVTKRDKGKDSLSRAMQIKNAAFEDARELLRDTGFHAQDTAFRKRGAGDA